MTTFPSAQNHARHPPQGLDELRKSTVSSDAKTQLTDFSQIPQILCARFRCMASFTSPGHISTWDFYFDISEWHILPARAWTPVLMLPLTNPCAKRKVLSLTKPKSKIYKRKSLGHYITCRKVRPLAKRFLINDTKQHLTVRLLSSSLEEMWSIPSFPLLPSSLWFGLVVPVRAPSTDQIELFDHLIVCKQMTVSELLVLHSNT